jgi:hypothetical protein
MRTPPRIIRTLACAPLIGLFLAGNAIAQVAKTETVTLLAQPGTKATQQLSGCKQTLKITVRGEVGSVGFVRCETSVAHCIVLPGHQLTCTETTTGPNKASKNGLCGVAAPAKSPALAVCEVRK